jgi:hypothetical protein
MLNLKPASPLLLLSALAACASTEGQFPSLERRAYETSAPITPPAESPAAPSVLSAELATKVDTLLARHRAAQAAYQNGLPAVQSTASRASGTSPGNEAWVNAHVVLSRLDKARSDSVGVLRDFDALIAEAGARDAGMAALLTEAQRPVADDLAAQNAEIARLSRLIGE